MFSQYSNFMKFQTNMLMSENISGWMELFKYVKSLKQTSLFVLYRNNQKYHSSRDRICKSVCIENNCIIITYIKFLPVVIRTLKMSGVLVSYFIQIIVFSILFII